MFVSTWSNLCRLAERHSCKPCPATWAAATRATSYTHTCRYCMCASMYYNAVWHRIQACYVMHTHMHACVHQDSMQQQSDRQKDPQPGKSIYIHTYIHTTFLFPFLFIYCAKECYGIEFGQLHTYQCKCNIYMFVKCVSVCVCVCVCACVRVYTCVCAWIYVIHTLYQACRWEDGVAEAVWLKRLHISAKEPHVTAKDPYASTKEPYISAKELYDGIVVAVSFKTWSTVDTSWPWGPTKRMPVSSGTGIQPAGSTWIHV